MNGIIIKEGFENMDFIKVTDMLSKSFWSPNIQIEEVKKGAINSAMVVGTFVENDIQIGYARVVSDKTRFAYILDVYIDESYRNKGVGTMIINHILNSPQLSDVYQWLLITKDAHKFYGKFNFKPVERYLDLLEIRHKRPQR